MQVLAGAGQPCACALPWDVVRGSLPRQALVPPDDGVPAPPCPFAARASVPDLGLSHSSEGKSQQGLWGSQSWFSRQGAGGGVRVTVSSSGSAPSVSGDRHGDCCGVVTTPWPSGGEGGTRGEDDGFRKGS